MASLALGWIGEATVAGALEPPLELLIGRWSVAVAHSIGTVVAFALVTALHIVLGEQVPKTVAIRHTEGTLLIRRRADGLVQPVLPAADLPCSMGPPRRSCACCASSRSAATVPCSPWMSSSLIVRESQEGGAIEADQEEMLQKVFEFGERQVREVMIPRPDVVGIEKGATLQELLAIFAEARHARFPVYDDDLDNIVGIVAVKDILLALAQDSTQMGSRIDSAGPPGPLCARNRRRGRSLCRAAGQPQPDCRCL